ncbi:sugar ABC transporter substrate-binding protein [Lichenicola cladoniae]|uniref:Sugar ABC transporter substrate-binding protein n=1 Tax=Lichenicola cladoniae TaxID=1484109 RepID=A0A6M8HR67_9PROT|nr:sugar ABC transporter substrate-binding protein [Lichenicola cladoniae]NPD69150.1 sugar ABC transporter substrate-binding protein [Acetobacteraceae bacterium]QKE90969.1 sugar ABC transporter substrate-binding protein [Lichenicola cladoniae]
MTTHNRLLATVAAAGLALGAGAASADTTLTIATVNNVQMIEMQKLSPVFEKAHPDIHLRWVVLEENTLRQRVTTDIATHGGQFDIMTIGNYEVPLWAKQKWLQSFDNLPASYDENDIIGPVKDGLSYQGHVYALPFYAESAMTLYRKDLFDKAGLKMPEAPTYEQIRQFADKLTDKSQNVFGMCLRGKPGWGENIAYFSTLVTAFGGQWFDANWKATLNTPAWHTALTYYSDILKADGPPGISSNGFNENLALFSSGHCAMWIDATSAAGTVYDKKQSQVADKVGFAAIPTGSFQGGPTWLWSWNLAIPSSSKHVDAAKTFITWATSKEYIALVAETDGWVNIPPGTRISAYQSPDYKQVAPFSDFVLAAIQHSNPNGKTANPRPYVGAQFVDIPEFQGIGTQVGQIIAATLTGATTVDNALSTANTAAERTMHQAGYPK